MRAKETLSDNTESSDESFTIEDGLKDYMGNEVDRNKIFRARVPRRRRRESVRKRQQRRERR
jgi:hypothetical protein